MTICQGHTCHTTKKAECEIYQKAFKRDSVARNVFVYNIIAKINKTFYEIQKDSYSCGINISTSVTIVALYIS